MKKKLIQLGIFFLALTFIIIGIGREEVAILFMKAVNICWECIGLG